MVAKKLISVYGLLKNVEFHQASGIIEDLCRQNKDEFQQPVCKGMLEYEWVDFMETKKKSAGGELWSFNADVIIFEDTRLIGDFEKFVKWTQANYQYNDFRPLPLWHAMAKEKYKAHLLESKHDFVYMEVEVSSEPIGKLLIELYSDKCPKTCKNFIELCRGGSTIEYEKRDPPLELTYKKSIFHRIVPNGWIQGGDFVTQKGTGGQSIYGAVFEGEINDSNSTRVKYHTRLGFSGKRHNALAACVTRASHGINTTVPTLMWKSSITRIDYVHGRQDENFSVPHNKRGILGMANKGRHTNGSQFYITLQPTPWMDTKYVAFGQVIEGMNVLKILESQETYNERPKQKCVIADCGILDVEKLWT